MIRGCVNKAKTPVAVLGSVPLLVPAAMLFLVVILGLAGCDKGPVLDTLAAGGSVTYKGQSVEDASVLFFPVNPETGKAASGITDSGGRFKLRTQLGGSKNVDGALAGDYMVTVVKTSQAAAMPGSATTDEEKKKLMDEMKAKRSADTSTYVKSTPAESGASSQPSGADSQLPAKYADLKSSKLTATVKNAGENDFKFDLNDDASAP